MHFLVPSIDSQEATLLELLESDMEDFFFGVPVTIETEEENARRCKHVSPIKTLKYQATGNVTRKDQDTGALKEIQIEYKFKVRVYKNQNKDNSQCPICRKLNMAPLSASGICD